MYGLGVFFIGLFILLILYYWMLYSKIIVNDQVYLTPDSVYVKVINKNFLTVTVSSTSDCWDVFTLDFLLNYREINF